jgi:hypothetical protein
VEARLTPDVVGVQIVYRWRDLEPQKDVYRFDRIEADLAFLGGKGKQLWVQLQDRFFRPEDRGIPDYVLDGAAYRGGLARQKDRPGEGVPESSGWVTKQWNGKVRARFQKLLRALAARCDGRIYGLNLPETAADVDMDVERRASGFHCDDYFRATLENIEVAKSVFLRSHVVQYVNFWPCEWNNDRDYMGRMFRTAVRKGIGLGGPDVVPYRKAQMRNAYPFFHRHHAELPIVAFAVQEPTRTYVNPETGKPFTDREFLDFATGYLGARILFWSVD